MAAKPDRKEKLLSQAAEGQATAALLRHEGWSVIESWLTRRERDATESLITSGDNGYGHRATVLAIRELRDGLQAQVANGYRAEETLRIEHGMETPGVAA